jgi:ribosomal protein RSM22 (predicted rRNA methylase)
MNDNTSVGDLAEELRAALDHFAQGLNPAQVTKHVDALSSRYRAGGAATSPILSTTEQVAAYAIYRMPATFAAATAALRETAVARPGFTPKTLIDLGGGTGAATWAAASVFPSLTTITVIDHAADALRMGRSLATRATRPALARATWRQGQVARDLPRADLVVVSYVLSELSPQQQRAVAEAAAEAGRVVVVLEPGTPDGYRRVLDARDVLLNLGGSVVAPCPHGAPCPLTGSDWCHFAVRVARSSLHRRAKQAQLGHEDEKFAYLAVDMNTDREYTSRSRVLRNPQKRKGLVQLALCNPDGTAVTKMVSKKHGVTYRSARNTEWGDNWPPRDSYPHSTSISDG